MITLELTREEVNLIVQALTLHGIDMRYAGEEPPAQLDQLIERLRTTD